MCLNVKKICHKSALHLCQNTCRVCTMCTMQLVFSIIETRHFPSRALRFSVIKLHWRKIWTSNQTLRIFTAFLTFFPADAALILPKISCSWKKCSANPNTSIWNLFVCVYLTEDIPSFNFMSYSLFNHGSGKPNLKYKPRYRFIKQTKTYHPALSTSTISSFIIL